MNKEPNILNICEECDYCLALCDGDIASCISAITHGANSEISKDSGAFEKEQFYREG